jgi:CheY-like chemotaxis protein
LVSGRTLLLADDSVTVQKVVDLTFADEGIQVIAVSDGEQAIARLDTFLPDIVLADVFMPKVNGYEVCDYIKRHDRLSHIPVMLLVGSFEPFDEAEARRVGADDYLTKPFQSIRQLVQKVGALLGKKPSKETATQELPPITHIVEPDRSVSDTIEISTADTRPLSPLSQDKSFNRVADRHEQSFADLTFEEELAALPAKPEKLTESKHDEIMSPFESIQEPFGAFAPEKTEVVAAPFSAQRSTSSINFSHSAGADDALLDLGELDPPLSSVEADDFILELRDELLPQPSNHAPSAETAMPVAAEVSTERASARIVGTVAAPLHVEAAPISPIESAVYSGYSDSAPGLAASSAKVDVSDPATHPPISAPTGTAISPELVEMIARRVVELMSAEVIERIAWEVVPQLSELMIKKQLDDRHTKTH